MIDKMKTVPEQIISGALHYFRVHPELWDDRLDKAVAMGLNTIETYIPWNLHEPHQGEFVFTGICDVEKFIHKAHERDLAVIVRPGPYICSEWDNGGFPGWLNALPGVRLRCFNQVYLDAVEKYFSVLLERLRPLLITQSGPIIMMQIENEYGSYGNDKAYLQYLFDLFQKYKIDVPYFTSDGPYGLCLPGGTLDHVQPTVNFGMNCEKAFDALQRFRPGAQDFCMEFWDGWFDHWGEKHHLRPAEDGGDAFDSEFEKMVSRKAGVNLYMYHGGTNFGFTAGANGNHFTDYAPVVTSYDYDCPLSEAGDPTEKYFVCQRILKKYTDNPRIRPVKPSRKIAPQPAVLTEYAPLKKAMTALCRKQGNAVVPPTMEELGENFGFICYRTGIQPFEGTAQLKFINVNDYAQVWVDGKYLGSSFRGEGIERFSVTGNHAGSTLEILVENCGRINYGPYIGLDHKGISGAVCLGSQQLFHWEYQLLPMDDVSEIEFSAPFTACEGPSFYAGSFEVEDIADTFLKRPGSKGVVWINGFNLGRYWDKGPTETLYVPSPVLKKGKNKIVIFEQEKLLSDRAFFSDVPDLGEIG